MFWVSNAEIKKDKFDLLFNFSSTIKAGLSEVYRV